MSFRNRVGQQHCGGAVQERPKLQCEFGVILGGAAELPRRHLLDKSEVGTGFADGARLASSSAGRQGAGVRVKQLIIMRHFQRVLDVGFGHLLQGIATGKFMPDASGDAQQQSAQKVLAIVEAAVDGGGVRFGSARHGTHGKGALSASPPEHVGGMEDALFEAGIGLPGHGSSISGRGRFAAQDSIDNVYITLYI